jgi:hypothetical protein
MDICFQALQGETTGRLAADATRPAAGRARTDAERRRREAARTSSALHVAAAAPYLFGDITGLATWFCLALRPEGEGTKDGLDVAA